MAKSVQPPTFMLTPDFSYKPDEDIHLGTLLLLSEETKLPDPDLPINNDSRVVLSTDQIKSQIEQPWKFDNREQLRFSGSVDAEVPLFVPAQGGFGYGSDSKQVLSIVCDSVETRRFVPGAQYLTQALNNDFVLDYCRKHWFPSVYLVTGMKIAQNAKIHTRNASEHGGRGKLAVDATSAGVPLKVGPSAHLSSEKHQKTETFVAGPFVLAYQLKRLRLKGNASLKRSEGFNKFALFDDTPGTQKSECRGVFSDDWEVTDVDQETSHDA